MSQIIKFSFLHSQIQIDKENEGGEPDTISQWLNVSQTDHFNARNFRRCVG